MDAFGLFRSGFDAPSFICGFGMSENNAKRGARHEVYCYL